MSAVIEGWFVSSALVGSIVGVGFAGLLSDRFGRKKIIILSAILFSITALGCMLSGSETELIVFRFIGGLGIGIASIVSPLYLSEISPARMRGKMVSLYQMAITIGILTIYISNLSLLNLSQDENILFKSELWQKIFRVEVWRSMFGIGIIPAVLFLLLLFIIPESPRWLIKKGFRDKAIAIFLRFRSKEDVDSEFSVSAPAEEDEKTEIRIFRRYRKPIFIGIAFAFLVQFSGITAVIYYGAKILNLGSQGINNAYSGQMLIGIINVVFTIIAILFIDKLGRRFLTILGAGIALICHSSIGLLFYLGYNDSIFLTIFILLYTAAFAASYGPVFWTVISEIYPNKIRGRAMSIAAFANWIATALVAQMIPWMLENLKPSGTFWMFAIFSVPALYFALRILPETKGKTLEEIEKMW